jgi:hypothetical protein
VNPLYQILTSDPKVQKAINYVRNQFPGMTAECFDSPVGWTPAGWPGGQAHLVTFRKGTQEETVIAGLLAYYPDITVTEFKAIFK